MSEILKGYEKYLKDSDDPNLDKSNLFFIFNSLKAWDIEGGKDIPKTEIIINELRNNRFLAHP